MKVVVDNNVVLDALLSREPFRANAEIIMIDLCSANHKGYITANSLTDIFFVLQKDIKTGEAKAAIRKLTELFEIIDVVKDDCTRALSIDMDDFEDAVVAVCANKARADYVVTRDKKFLKSNAPVAVIAPDELIEKLFT